MRTLLVPSLLCSALFLLLLLPVGAVELRIAAAADLKFAFDELLAEFRSKRPGIRPQVTYGSSGNFFSQIQNQAPFDLYFSADVDYARRLIESGHALDTNVFLYGVGRIVIWVPRRSDLDVGKLGMESLISSSVRKIAVANPMHAPYGRAAMAAMRSSGVLERVEARLVFGDNVLQAAQFVRSGAADIGIIALSLAVSPQMREAGRYWTIPTGAHPKLEQGGIIVRSTKHADEARALRDFVLGEEGRRMLGRHGFSPPEKRGR